MSTGLGHELTALLGRYNADGQTQTPDYILATFMIGCLTAFEDAVMGRDSWWHQYNQQAVQIEQGRHSRAELAAYADAADETADYGEGT